MTKIISTLRQGLVDTQLRVGRIFSIVQQGNVLTTVVTGTEPGAAPVHGPSLLLESGSYLLLESGDALNLG